MDYSSTPHAQRERYDKAKAIAVTAWDLGLTPENLLHDLTDAQWSALARRATDGKPASEETKRLTYCHLSLKEAWAAGHPADVGSQRAIRPLADVVAELTRKAPR